MRRGDNLRPPRTQRIPIRPRVPQLSVGQVERHITDGQQALSHSKPSAGWQGSARSAVEHHIQRPIPDPTPNQRDHFAIIRDQIAHALETRQHPAGHAGAEDGGGSKADGASGSEQISKSANQQMEDHV